MSKKTRLIISVPAMLTAITLMAEMPSARIAEVGGAKIADTHSIKVTPAKRVALNSSAAGLAASFTIRGAEAEQTVWSEDFEASTSLPQGWSTDATTHAVWSMKAPSTSYNDETNSNALFVDGDYRMYNREITSAYSAPISVPQGEAMLHAYIYYSLNYDEYCRLIISASTDDFVEDVAELWNSKDGTGEKTAHWHAVEATLAQYAGKTIRLRFTYSWGSKDETFKSGGYMGSFYIDGVSVTSPTTIERVDVMTGEPVEFVDTSTGEIASWEWSMPGATPATSTDKNPSVYYTQDGTYDVSLTVTDVAGNSSTATVSGFVNVTGYAPTARMAITDGFNYVETFHPMVAPFAEITFTDASEGYPTNSTWNFVKYNDISGTYITSDEKEGLDVTTRFPYLHNWEIEHEVSNQHGTSKVTETVSAEYSGSITNFRAGDYATTFDLEGNGTFPGNNKMKITMYAEKFSKPTTPIIIEGVNAYFATAAAEQLGDQVSNVGVHLYTSENGLPGERIESWWWQIVDLDASSDASVATWFPFTSCPMVDDEFFIVVDGFADLYDDTDLSLYMADFRGAHNTTLMYKEGKWVDVSTYFPAGKNHTSLLVVPYIDHSVIGSATGAEPVLIFDEKGGSKTFSLFSYLGYKTPVATGADWCNVTNEPNGMTVDDLVIECAPLPDGITERETTVTPTDGYSTYSITVRQVRNSGVEAIDGDGEAVIVVDGLRVSASNGGEVTLYTLQGVKIASGIRVEAPSAGMYIVVSEGAVEKVGVR